MSQTAKKTTPVVKEEQKPQNSTENKGGKIVQLRPLSVDERLRKMEEFNQIAQRHQMIKDKKAEFSKYKFSSLESDDTLILKSMNGKEFKTGSETILKAVTDIVKKYIDEALERAEKDINNFVI